MLSLRHSLDPPVWDEIGGTNLIYFSFRNRGITATSANMENSNPPMDPTAKENQNGSLLPSMRKGIRPSTVDTMVRKTAVIL